MKEDRKKIYEQYVKQFGKPESFVKRVIVEYDRYHEANLVIKRLGRKIANFSHTSVLDYGCGAGDYGISFARLGSKVCFYDFENMLRIIAIRAKNENLESKCTGVIVSPETIFEIPTIVIFGEVLEHLDNPYETLAYFVDNKTKYIVTSSYPYRSDNANDPYWKHGGHTMNAFKQQKLCKEMLEEKYQKSRLDGQLNVWEIK